MSVNYGNPAALEQWLSARPTRNPVLETMRDTFDSGDAWGSTLSWHFAICDVISEIDPSQIPSAWEYQQSPFGADTEQYEYTEVLEAMRGDGATLDDLIHAGNVLSRYAAQLRLAGQDY